MNYICSEDLTTGLCVQNYSKFFSLLLFMEEHQTIADLKEYTMWNVKPKRVKNMLEIEVCVFFLNSSTLLKGSYINQNINTSIPVINYL